MTPRQACGVVYALLAPHPYDTEARAQFDELLDAPVGREALAERALLTQLGGV